MVKTTATLTSHKNQKPSQTGQVGKSATFRFRNHSISRPAQFRKVSSAISRTFSMPFLASGITLQVGSRFTRRLVNLTARMCTCTFAAFPRTRVRARRKPQVRQPRARCDAPTFHREVRKFIHFQTNRSAKYLPHLASRSFPIYVRYGDMGHEGKITSRESFHLFRGMKYGKLCIRSFLQANRRVRWHKEDMGKWKIVAGVRGGMKAPIKTRWKS